MPSPTPPTFDAQVSQALEKGRERGHLLQSEIDALLRDEAFDESAFDVFLDLTRQLNLEIRDDVPLPEIDAGAPDLDSLQIYMRDVGRYALLTAEEERQLGRTMREGTTPHRREEARRTMILANLRLVVKIAHGYINRGVPFMDLIEEGNLGLIAGVDRFDYQRGFRFSTYGSWWIKQAVARGVANQARTVRIPFHVIQLVNRYIATEARLRHKQEEDPTLPEVAAAMHEPAKRIERVKHLIHSIKNLDYESSWDAMGSLAETEMIRPPVDFESQVEQMLEHERLNRLLGRLSTREEMVLRIRYGFDDGQYRSLADTGERMGVSRERIRQIEKRALERLKRYVEITETGEG